MGLVQKIIGNRAVQGVLCGLIDALEPRRDWLAILGVIKYFRFRCWSAVEITPHGWIVHARQITTYPQGSTLFRFPFERFFTVVAVRMPNNACPGHSCNTHEENKKGRTKKKKRKAEDGLRMEHTLD